MTQKTIFWLAAAVIITIVFGTIELAVQQDWRQSANIPLIQRAEDVAQAVEQGVPAAAAVGPTVNVAATHDVFAAVYDHAGQLQASSGRVDGQTPQPPTGVFSHVGLTQQDRFTWQLANGLRFATVVTAIDNGSTITGYALAAQRLDYVEQQESKLERNVLAGWLASLLVLVVAAAASAQLSRSRM